MAKFYNGQSRSSSNQAKRVIREEISAYYKPHDYGVRSTVDAMKKEAEDYGKNKSKHLSNYAKGAGLADVGRLSYASEDQRKMLGKIYGKGNVEGWNEQKVHDTYKHLIGREYDSMLREQEKKKAARMRVEKQAKKSTPKAKQVSKSKAKSKRKVKR